MISILLQVMVVLQIVCLLILDGFVEEEVRQPMIFVIFAVLVGNKIALQILRNVLKPVVMVEE